MIAAWTEKKNKQAKATGLSGGFCSFYEDDCIQKDRTHETRPETDGDS